MGLFKRKKQPEKKKAKKLEPIEPIPFDESIATGKVWGVNHNSGTIVSPVTNEIVSHDDQNAVFSAERREPIEDERRSGHERRVGEPERRKKKVFRLFNRRKNAWQRRSEQDRRYGKGRREDDKLVPSKLLDSDISSAEKESATDYVGVGERESKKAATVDSVKTVITSENAEDFENDTVNANERYEIHPHMKTKREINSASILSSRISVDNKDERMVLGHADSFVEGETTLHVLSNREELVLEDGKKIADIYSDDSNVERVKNYLEIYESAVKQVYLKIQYAEKSIILAGDDQKLQVDDAVTQEGLYIIANNDLTIDLNDNQQGEIHIGSYKTFGF